MAQDRFDDLVNVQAALPAGADNTEVEIAIGTHSNVPPTCSFGQDSASTEMAIAADIIESTIACIVAVSSTDVITDLEHHCPNSVEIYWLFFFNWRPRSSRRGDRCHAIRCAMRGWGRLGELMCFTKDARDGLAGPEVVAHRCDH